MTLGPHLGRQPLSTGRSFSLVWSHSPQAASGRLPFSVSSTEPHLYRVCHTKSSGQEPHLISRCPGLQQTCNLAVQEPDLTKPEPFPHDFSVVFWPHSSAQPPVHKAHIRPWFRSFSNQVFPSFPSCHSCSGRSCSESCGFQSLSINQPLPPPFPPSLPSLCV